MGNPIVARPLGQQRMLPIDSSEKRPRHLSASLVPNFQNNTFFLTAEEFMTESFYLGLSQNRGTSKLGWFRFGSLYTSPKRVQKTTRCLPPLSLSLSRNARRAARAARATSPGQMGPCTRRVSRGIGPDRSPGGFPSLQSHTQNMEV